MPPCKLVDNSIIAVYFDHTMKRFASVALLLLLLTNSGWTQPYAYPVERRPVNSDAPAEGRYKILLDQPRQVIKGLGFEIQSDAIGSGNNGLPDKQTSVPHDLVKSERTRFYNDMLKNFRYCRLAGGLYWRGLANGDRNIVERWPEQDDELLEMMKASGVEGLSFEYWSPAPYWKANRKYTGNGYDNVDTNNKLRCFGNDFHNDPDYKGDTLRFLKDFAAAMVRDILYLRKKGLPVKVFGIQNEPMANTPYSSCVYTNEEYYTMFRVVAPIIKKRFPEIEFITDTHLATHSFAEKIAADKALSRYVDAWVYHRIGEDADSLIVNKDWYLHNTGGKPVYQNEYEYLIGPTSAARCLNTVQNIMNWFTFINSPTWYWIHALKPTYNTEASGYALGFWRPYDDEKTTRVEKGHWYYNNHNWFAVAGFLKHMPWNSRRMAVKEKSVRLENRIFSFRRPDGKLVLVVSNRSGKPYTFKIDAGLKRKFRGYRYTPENGGVNSKGVDVAPASGPHLSLTVPDMAWEFWIQE